jgi:hypothetical protein
MSPLEVWRREQHNELIFTSDHGLTAFLAEASPEIVRLDLEPTTDIESRHLAFLRRTA